MEGTVTGHGTVPRTSKGGRDGRSSQASPSSSVPAPCVSHRKWAETRPRGHCWDEKFNRLRTDLGGRRPPEAPAGAPDGGGGGRGRARAGTGKLVWDRSHRPEPPATAPPSSVMPTSSRQSQRRPGHGTTARRGQARWVGRERAKETWHRLQRAVPSQPWRPKGSVCLTGEGVSRARPVRSRDVAWLGKVHVDERLPLVREARHGRTRVPSLEGPGGVRATHTDAGEQGFSAG